MKDDMTNAEFLEWVVPVRLKNAGLDPFDRERLAKTLEGAPSVSVVAGRVGLSERVVEKHLLRIEREGLH